MNPETKTAIENAIRCYYALNGFPPSAIMISEDEHKDLNAEYVTICGKSTEGDTFLPSKIYRWNLPGVTATSKIQVEAMHACYAATKYTNLTVIP